MRTGRRKKFTYNELMGFMEVLYNRIENNQRAIYDLRAEFGSAAQIPTRWSVFKKFFKDRYLQLKKKLDY
jgi:hypothetical protein